MVSLLLATVSQRVGAGDPSELLTILLLAALVPAAAVLLVGLWHPVLVLLSCAQGAALFFGLRAVFRWVRRRDYTPLAGSGLLCLAYLPLCLVSNALFVAGAFLCRAY